MFKFAAGRINQAYIVKFCLGGTVGALASNSLHQISELEKWQAQSPLYNPHLHPELFLKNEKESEVTPQKSKSDSVESLMISLDEEGCDKKRAESFNSEFGNDHSSVNSIRTHGEDALSKSDSDYDKCSIPPMRIHQDESDISEVSSQADTDNNSIIEPDQHHGFRIVSFPAYPPSLLASFRESPPTTSEIQGCIQTLFSGLPAVEKLLPEPIKELNPVQRSLLADDLFDLMIDPDVINVAQNNIKRLDKLEELKMKKQRRLIYKEPSFYIQNSPEEWEKLVEQWRCPLCQDLFAAPVLTQCTHTFCGACLHNYLKKKEADCCDDCPMCHKSVGLPIFERSFDDCICKEVDKIPDIPPKEEWKQRRNQYFAEEHNKANPVILDESIPQYIFYLVGLVIVIMAGVRLHHS